MLSPMMQCAGRIRVKDCPFGAPDGVASQFQLADRHGHPVTKDVRIASIHQTDWQGRIELSSEPRTNLAIAGSDPHAFGTAGGWQINGDGSLTENYGTAPNGKPNATGLAANPNDTGVRVDLRGDMDFEQGKNYCAGIFFKLGDAGSIQLRYRATAGFSGGWSINADTATGSIISVASSVLSSDVEKLPGGWCLLWCSQECLSSASAFPWYITVDGDAAKNGIELWGALTVYEKSPGAYIPTTYGSPVTVTDYTHDGAGGITTGQVPVAAATLDWTGTARRTA